jgi:CubicO group peptidase (beta-lactamase class C family)
MFRFLKKGLKIFGWFLLVVLISLNLFVVLSGRFYLYKGVYSTYLQGESSPTIYDKEKFYSATVKHGKPNVKWTFHEVSEKGLESWLKYAEKWHSASILVAKGNTILFEKYWGEHHPSTVSNSFSSAKTIVSILIGCAIEDGKIKNLDEPVKNYLPEFTGKGKEKITIRHLLMMASGLDWQESGSNPLSENAESYYGTDLWGLIHRQQPNRKPGEMFLYQSGNSQILGFILEKATGEKLSDYASRKIWKPIGAESDAFWSLDKENGAEKSFCCLYSTTRDFARVGVLLAHKGEWEGKQVIPRWYFDEMIKNPKLDTEEGILNTRYGLHIWTYNYHGHEVIYCRGIKGQYIISVPDQDLVIVRTGHKRAPDVEFPEDRQVSASERKTLLPKIGHPSDLFEYLDFGFAVMKKSDLGSAR